MTDSEIAVRENGSVTAVELDSLDQNISVDLDHDPPLVGVPEETAVVYETDVDLVDERADDVAADGGMVRDRVSMRQYGLGLQGEQRSTALGIIALAYAASGYIVATSETFAGLVTFAAATLAVYFLFYREESDD
ncbi:hypothetical protein [Halobellus rarus]|uniref:Uncharacterized protein n=1 Tax=Halobellus rarus TaxID=1126237 RepID=A0ABD6CMU3_9EURY|nr:hypothetical protein [Halobellus rarus]